ncbi:hypothetical protein KC19_2G135000 [Ceratodon purpureus]|uniref:Dof-type domain-containing protein n=1 Tax=Ceratodon purpureus TaxID=3225 RepID=A0A8T0IW21_CERPU|nr:hypothetical protein KC19_2G135000 [Ceratodon purpureus]
MADQKDQKVHCVHCGSSNLKFKFLNNKKPDQHRYKCLNCEAIFTWEDHKRPKPKHYKKVRNEDPVEIQGQRTQCNKCFAVNNARFKFYNNKKKYGETQPRFRCLSCKNYFQMHLKDGVLVAIKTRSKKSPTLNANEDDQLDMFDILFPAEGENPPDPSHSLQLQDAAQAAYECNLDDSSMHDEDHHEGPHHASPDENPYYDWENDFGELIDNPNYGHANDHSSDSSPSALSTDGLIGMMDGVSEALAAADMIYLSDFEKPL